MIIDPGTPNSTSLHRNRDASSTACTRRRLLSTEANKKLVLSFFENFSAGRAEAFLAQMADTATWWVAAKPESFPLAGTKTRAEFAELMKGIGPGLQVKTDRVDVGKLARKLEKGDLKAIYIPSRTLHEQRQIGRTYVQSIKERQRAQVRIRSLLQEQGRLGPPPAVGWTAYRTWLTGQQLQEPVRACVEVHQ